MGFWRVFLIQAGNRKLAVGGTEQPAGVRLCNDSERTKRSAMSVW